MSDCVICGSSRNASYRYEQRQTLCEACARTTPGKVSRERFEARYWAGCGEVPASTRREFYEDYLRSEHTLDGYIAVTVTVTEV